MGRFSELDKIRIETDFESAGYAKIENLVSAGAVAELVAAYDDIIEGRVSCGEFDRN
jgi:hypothetical protein